MNNILITGVSRGIGQATAQTFLENGWKVYGTSTSGKVSLEDTNLEVFQLDLSDTPSLERFKQNFNGNKIDVLLNNSGIGLDEAAPPIDIGVLRKDLEVNLFGTIRITEMVKDNINENGKIISISSMMGALSDDFSYGDPSYRISKAALNMFTKNLSVDPIILKKNISVCSFDPGWVKTDMGGPNAPRQPEEPAKELFELASNGFISGKFYRGLNIRAW